MEWLALIDKALGTNFDAPVYDPQKGRDKLSKVIDNVAKQHTEGSTKAPNRAWRAGNNNAIEFKARLDGKPVLLDGQEKVYVPAEHFQSFLTKLKKSVQAGELDKQIKAALDGEKAATGTTAKASGTSGSTRAVGSQSALNIGVAAKRRSKTPPSFEDIRKSYIDAGSDPAEVDFAIAKRKEAEGA